MASDEATIRIWTIANDGAIALHQRTGAAVTQIALGGWTIAYDPSLPRLLHQLRDQKLPDETGGVLLGIADLRKRTIHLVTALGQPSDSTGTTHGFERGTEGLMEAMQKVAHSSLHQLRYVGEWHSHPRNNSALPSSTDIQQIAWLRRELVVEGLPAFMVIAADGGERSFILSEPQDGSST
ncbi:MAG: Mov34/MPN/PAD-1 family protein [Hyphomicrobium sp.]